jgi:transcriptional regulator with GAF, ATPase, and Fis domain
MVPGILFYAPATIFSAIILIQTFETKSWKLFIEKHHIESFIVLPIKKAGSFFGTFNLYSTEPNYFGRYDILSLNEVTADISFALDMFEKAETHKESRNRTTKEICRIGRSF